MTRAGVRSPLPSTRIAGAVARALDAAGAPPPGSVTIVLADDAELAELNLEHIGVEGPTDVLSFPMFRPSAFGHGAADDLDAVRVPAQGRRTHVGDIAISVERAIEQAEQGRGGQTGDIQWSPADELRLLVIHGTLHLCGRDHANSVDESGMRALEAKLLGDHP